MADDLHAVVTFTDGPTLPASTLNEQIRDNITAAINAIRGDAQATGELIHRHKSGTNAARPAADAANVGRLYLATDDPKCLYMDNGGAWIVVGGDVPRAHVYRATDQAILTATFTPISFSTERKDNNAMWAIGDPTKLIAKTAGYFDFDANVVWQSGTGSGYRQLAIRVNGTTTIASTLYAENGGTWSPMQNLGQKWQMAVNDYAELMVQHEEGANQNVVALTAYSPDFSMVMVSE
jgi:hypothetical protein